MNQSPWTREHELRLEELVLQGYSASQIAWDLKGGFTRNAVVGKASRMGLRLGGGKGGYGSGKVAAPRAPRPDRGSSAPKRPRVKPHIVHNAPLAEVVRPVAAQPLPVTVAPLHGAGVPFLDRDRSQCAWPLWEDGREPDKRCCGQPVAGESSYCSAHQQVSVGQGTASERAALRLPLKRAA